MTLCNNLLYIVIMVTNKKEANNNSIHFLISDTISAALKNILDMFPRSRYKNPSALYREALSIGLQKIYKKALKEKQSNL